MANEISFEEFNAKYAPKQQDTEISFDDFNAKYAAEPKSRSFGEVAGDVGSQLGKGVNTIAGAIPNLLDPSSPVSKFFNDNAQYWQNDQSQITKSLEAAADARIAEAAKTGQWEAFKTAVKEYGAEPALVQKLILENIPSMIPGLAAAKGAQIAAKGSVIAGTVAGAGTNSVLNAGGARQESYQDIKKTLIEQGMSEAEADAQALEKSKVAAGVGAATGALSGGSGLERGILGGAKGGFAKRAGVELGGEQLEEVAPTIATNMQLDRDTLTGVGETSAKTLIASSPGSVISGFQGNSQPVQPTPPGAAQPDIASSSNVDELISATKSSIDVELDNQTNQDLLDEISASNNATSSNAPVDQSYVPQPDTEPRPTIEIAPDVQPTGDGEYLYQGVRPGSDPNNPSYWFTDDIEEAKMWARSTQGDKENVGDGHIAVVKKADILPFADSVSPSGRDDFPNSTHYYTGGQKGGVKSRPVIRTLDGNGVEQETKPAETPQEQPVVTKRRERTPEEKAAGEERLRLVNEIEAKTDKESFAKYGHLSDDSVFNGEILKGLEDIVMNDNYNGAPIDLGSKGYTLAEQKILESVGLATNGTMSEDQFHAFTKERSRRFNRKRREASEQKTEQPAPQAGGSLGADNGQVINGATSQGASGVSANAGNQSSNLNQSAGGTDDTRTDNKSPDIANTQNDGLAPTGRSVAINGVKDNTSTLQDISLRTSLRTVDNGNDKPSISSLNPLRTEILKFKGEGKTVTGTKTIYDATDRLKAIAEDTGETSLKAQQVWFNSKRKTLEKNGDIEAAALFERIVAQLKERINTAQEPAPVKIDDQVATVATKPARETITPSEDTVIGSNAAGEKLYERVDKSRYRMRFDRKDRPYGYPDFGGDLAPTEPLSFPIGMRFNASILGLDEQNYKSQNELSVAIAEAEHNLTAQGKEALEALLLEDQFDEIFGEKLTDTEIESWLSLLDNNEENDNSTTQGTTESGVTEGTQSGEQDRDAEAQGKEGVEVAGKEPWQMTQKEYADSFGEEITGDLRERHVDAIKKAHAEGKTIPDEVIAKYPILRDRFYPQPKQESNEKPAAGKYTQPANVSDRKGQIELADRASRLVNLKLMNDEIGAYSDAEIQNVATDNIDAVQEYLRKEWNKAKQPAQEAKPQPESKPTDPISQMAASVESLAKSVQTLVENQGKSVEGGNVETKAFGLTKSEFRQESKVTREGANAYVVPSASRGPLRSMETQAYPSGLNGVELTDSEIKDAVFDKLAGGAQDVSKKTENVDTSKERVKGIDTSKLTYAKPSTIDTPAQGVLNQAREGKAKAWEKVQSLRERIKNEPLGGNRSGLRLELVKAEDSHREYQKNEKEALAAIEKRANELGFTTIKSNSPKFSKSSSTINVNGIERSRLNSNGKPIANTDEALHNFWEWFSDSKVVDDQGRPLVVYHGTNNSFDEFSKESVKSRFPYSFGLHFTTRTQEASVYADSLTNAAEEFNPKSKFAIPAVEGGNVMPSYLKSENPLEIVTDMSSASMEADTNRYDIIGKLMEAKKNESPYDSVIIKRQQGDEYDGQNIIVFDPNQVKSAIGNNGDFNKSNNSILKSQSTPTQNTHTVASATPALVNSHTGRVKAVVQAMLDSGKAKVVTAEQAAGIVGEDAMSSDAQAFYNPADKVTYFVADHIPEGYTPKEWEGLVLHEIATHAMQLGKDTKEFKSILSQIELMRKAGNKAVVAAFKRVPKDTRPENVTEEAIAYLLQESPQLGIVQRVLSWFRNAIRAIGKSFPTLQKMRLNVWANNLNESDLRFIAESALKNAEPSGVQNESDTPQFSKSSQTDTPAFQKWFGDSKVVDSEGGPLVVYHGTNDVFTVFDKEQSNTGAIAGWFSSDKRRADVFARNGNTGSSVMRVYLSLQNPIDMRQAEDRYRLETWRDIFSDAGISNIEFDTALYDNGEFNLWDLFPHRGQDLNEDSNLLEKIKEAGYDGIMYGSEHQGRIGEEYNYVAFDPNQIKSATGNNGNFSKSDNNILFSKNTNPVTHPFQPENSGKPLDSWIKIFTRNQIVTLYRDSLIGKKLEEYKELRELVAADINKLYEKADNFLLELRQIPKELRDAFASLAHDSTLNNVDPSNPKYVPSPDAVKLADYLADNPTNQTLAAKIKKRLNNMEAAHKKLHAEFSALPTKEQELFKELRSKYTEQMTMVFDEIKKRIGRTKNVDPAIKISSIKKLDEQLADLLGRVYFPLYRAGNYIVKAEKAGEPTTVDHVESNFAADRLEKKLKKLGYTVSRSTRIVSPQDNKSGEALNAVRDLLDKAALKGKIEGAELSQLMDDIDQTILQSLPDQSYRKSFIHRKGTKGYSDDFIRAYADAMRRGSINIANLRHGDKITTVIEDMRKDVKDASKVPGSNVAALNQVVDRVEQIEVDIRNPTSKLVSVSGKIAFAQMLGSLSNFILNITQTPLLTMPHLGAEYGYGQANLQLSMAYAKQMRSLKKQGTLSELGKWLDMRHGLTGNELDLMQQLHDSGFLDLTQSFDLIDAANNPSYQENELSMNFMKVIALPQHVSEIVNRQVTALATIRLEMARSGSPLKAYRAAIKAIDETHFNYSKENRAKLMTGNTQSILFRFKQYAQQAAFLFVHTAKLALDGSTKLDSDGNKLDGTRPSERTKARKQLAGVLGMQMLVAGTLGLPVFAEAAVAASGVAGFKLAGSTGAYVGVAGAMIVAAALAFGDDDGEEFDVEVKKWFIKHFGEGIGSSLADGVIPRGLASRLNASELVLRRPKEARNSTDFANQWMISLLGAFWGGTVYNAGVGLKDIAEGDTAKGATKLIPVKAIKDLVTSWKWANDGMNVTNKDGEIITPVSKADIFFKSIGINPTSVVNAREYENAKFTLHNALLKKQQKALKELREETDKTKRFNAIIKYNKSAPLGYEIDSDKVRGVIAREIKYKGKPNVVTGNPVQEDYLNKNTKELRPAY